MEESSWFLAESLDSGLKKTDLPELDVDGFGPDLGVSFLPLNPFMFAKLS